MNDAIHTMFADYGQTFKLRWGRVIFKGELEEKLKEVSSEYGCSQAIEKSDIIWKNEDNKVEALFRYIDDPTQINALQDIYQTIKRLDCPISFIVVNQTPDGRGNYDIFKFSEKSYLQHHNRFRHRG